MSFQLSIKPGLVRALFYCSAAAVLAGCAVGRDVVAVNPPVAANPATGQAVRIEAVMDNRKFEAAPRSADIPSMDDAEDTGPAIEARAIGRKRNAYGKALGDVVLREGQTVSKLTETALATAFQQSGFTVVRKGDANYDTALPVSARINQSWAWLQPGFWAVTVNHKSEVELEGAVKGLTGKQVVATKVSESKQIVTSDDWRIIVEKGLQALTDQTKQLLGRQQ